jgi:hypothetical protein
MICPRFCACLEEGGIVADSSDGSVSYEKDVQSRSCREEFVPGETTTNSLEAGSSWYNQSCEQSQDVQLRRCD